MTLGVYAHVVCPYTLSPVILQLDLVNMIEVKILLNGKKCQLTKALILAVSVSARPERTTKSLVPPLREIRVILGPSGATRW